MRLKVLIVDDEPVARATVRGLVEGDDDVELVEECGDGRRALERLGQEAFDVLFLDVEMPELDGLEVLSHLPREKRPVVVFTTAFDHFATRAFDESATDYLLKPFSDRRFAQALERVKESLRARALFEGDEGISDPGAGEPYTSRLTIHREGRLEVVPVEDLIWIQSADQYVRLHLERGEHLMRGSMGELERGLDPASFARVHRSAIVALERVRCLETRGGGTGRLQLTTGEWVPVSRSRVPLVRRLLG